MEGNLASLVSSVDLSTPWTSSAHNAFRSGLTNLTHNYLEGQRKWLTSLPWQETDDLDLLTFTSDSEAKLLQKVLLKFSQDLQFSGVESKLLKREKSGREDFPASEESRSRKVRSPQGHPFIPAAVMRQMMRLPRPSHRRPSGSKLKKRKSNDGKKGEEEEEKEEEVKGRPPIIFVPEETTKCIKTGQMSSFGFLSFALAVANIVINISNNVNNNNNNNNNNDNNNNNNDNNINIANNNNNVNSANEVMVGRRLQRLLQLQRSLNDHVYRSQRRTRRWTYTTQGAGMAWACPGGSEKVRARGLVGVAALLDLWNVSLTHPHLPCVAYRFCVTAGYLHQGGSVTSSVGVVGVRAAAHLLIKERGCDPSYLVWAAERGRSDVGECGRLFPGCDGGVVY
ncbi:hypothetical protein Hamer_G012799 [Homarus americanus]|uniref:Uncharacterized protein n=1 Tax=Homarus americanus TaxID=6706 RepID=A0A8J5JZI4_HOMAM|nr:hypothetical protein Hamer_G012799 [Homarus americanus]